MHAISFQDVSYEVTQKKILSQITGHFTKGRITTLVGPSGAGKTTLLKLCNGLLTPTTGQIHILNRAYEEYSPPDLRTTVGIALQAAPMIRGTVYDNLALPLTLKKQTLPPQKAAHYLEAVGLSKDICQQDARDLSGGQRQRVSIARTLINEPAILLLDEITSALDQAAADSIEKLIMQLNQQHDVTVIWITHNLEQALRVSDEVWVMIDGKLIQQGTPAILKQPTHQQVQQFTEGALR